MPIVNSIISWLTTKRLKQIHWYNVYPQEIQNEVLASLVRDAQETEWGKTYHYAGIATAEDFQKSVPLGDYESLKPYISRIQQGEQNILWHSPIRWFAKSSGTTNDKSKFVPVSKESLEQNHIRCGRDTIILYTHAYPENNLWRGKSLGLGGSHQVSNVSVDTYFGDVSAILMQHLPFWAQIYRTPDISVALMDEWEEKLQKIAELTATENVVSIAGVPSWMLVLLRKMITDNKADSVLDIWQNLELFIHGGVNFAPYREQFKAIIPSEHMHYWEVYNASEGFFGIQDSPDRDDMLLMIDVGVFYECIPMDDFYSEHPKTLLLHEVEMGVNYALVISTNAGLWRYIIGDTVIFTSRYPYRIKITGRVKHFINAFGEELMVDNAEMALAEACLRTGARVSEYTAAPIFMQGNSQGGHEWLIEFDTAPQSLQQFAEVLDTQLKALNSDYEAKRYKNMTLAPPTLRQVPQGTFYNWLKQKGKLGGQHKIPRLSNDRRYVEEITKVIEN
ncbi:MAG: GH3 auxin-responsive promoter family protein [Bacteroidales bacterium]|jgi:hypothetical protein|nr:GH3 auxin-responsive promoter family protein [Bacteroidales bacterium]